jgi:hypothetical protein
MMVPESIRLEGRRVELALKAKCPLRIWIIENAKEVLHPPTNLSVKFMEFSMAQVL